MWSKRESVGVDGENVIKGNDDDESAATSLL